MNPSLRQKYEAILSKEEHFAYELAKQVIEKPKASVWLIFLPVLFVFYAQRIQKYKAGSRLFANGYLRTKIIALDAAVKEAESGLYPEKIMAAVTPAADPPEKAKMREKQREEVDILRQHYLLLFRSTGNSFSELLRNAYQTSGAYRSFLNRLRRAEHGVNQEVVDSIQSSPEAREVVARMEKLSEQLREEELREIYTG